MPKSATISEIEHRIETLPPVEQLKLLEKMVRHLKKSFLRNQPDEHRKVVASDGTSTVRGLLSQYANPAFREQESGAFMHAMKEKHAPR